MEFIILMVILVCFFRRKDNENYYRPRRRNEKTQAKQSQWHSEWFWDEEKQLWIHPLSGNTPASNKQENIEEQAPVIDFSTAYQAKYLLTKNEWIQYKRLREIADAKGYVICPKVRLLDIIEPRKNHEKYKTLLYKTQAKHVDFLICDKDMHIKVIIELDDSSHDKKDRKERDQFVDLILQSVGYKIIHTQYITQDILDLV